ncbi:MAG: hypothetical protein CGW95_14945 [Phenylobacterium zucineum]|nr:MAG: hypothetical protein CGW95_14945 [Phenylobacterium zucineum]
MADVIVTSQFCGPPNSGNGGYCCGLLAADITGPATAVLKARIPLDVSLQLEIGEQAAQLADDQGNIIGVGRAAASSDLPTVPPPPSQVEAIAAEARHVGHTARYHPICFTCGPEREEGEGLRIFPGQIEGAELGHLACPWTPHPNFAGSDGLMPPEVIWGALDCPGYFHGLSERGVTVPCSGL